MIVRSLVARLLVGFNETAAYRPTESLRLMLGFISNSSSLNEAIGLLVLRFVLVFLRLYSTVRSLGFVGSKCGLGIADLVIQHLAMDDDDGFVKCACCKVVDLHFWILETTSMLYCI